MVIYLIVVVFHCDQACGLFFKKFLVDTCPFWGPVVPPFWISGDVSSGFQSQSGFCLIRNVDANVMYIPQDPPLVLHMLTSWLPAAQLVTSPHASVEVGLGPDSNRQSPAHKTNVLPLWQQPGKYVDFLNVSNVIWSILAILEAHDLDRACWQIQISFILKNGAI